jgi:hypothetical protein
MRDRFEGEAAGTGIEAADNATTIAIAKAIKAKTA